MSRFLLIHYKVDYYYTLHGVGTTPTFISLNCACLSWGIKPGFKKEKKYKIDQKSRMERMNTVKNEYQGHGLSPQRISHQNSL